MKAATFLAMLDDAQALAAVRVKAAADARSPLHRLMLATLRGRRVTKASAREVAVGLLAGLIDARDCSHHLLGSFECDVAESSRWGGQPAVYFIALDLPYRGAWSPIKVGISKAPEVRLADLQIGVPYPLRLLGSFPAVLLAERLVHRAFDAGRLHGEWFRSSVALRRLVAEVRAVSACVAWPDAPFSSASGKRTRIAFEGENTNAPRLGGASQPYATRALA